MKWQGDKWYPGAVKKYDSDPCSNTAGKHQIVYDDGDEKWYSLGEKTFSIVEGPAELIAEFEGYIPAS